MDVCAFCSLPPERILMESEHAIAFADAYPVTEGHTLVVPRRHVASIYELTGTEHAAIWTMVQDVRQELVARLHPDAFNIGVNDGVAAGQTVMHAHVHVIPRRTGDAPDPRGGVRWVIAGNAPYWRKA